MTDLDPVLLDAVARVVDRHEYDVARDGESIRPACTCGWVAEKEWDSVFVHSQHVASEVLLATASTIEAQALRDAADDAENHCDLYHTEQPACTCYNVTKGLRNEANQKETP